MVQSNKVKKDTKFIFLKSGVIALGLIFIVLLSLLVILKINKKEQRVKKSSCNKDVSISINSDIIKITDTKKEIILLGKVKNKKQELIILDKKCFNLKNVIQFKID